MADTRPNIIFIMTDQMRHDAIGAVTPYVHTPGIDSLARDGILYDEAVCQCPMCVPSRNSLMFGMYPSQCGVHTNNGALLDENRLPGVPLPQMLADAGYFCAGFGKTHWNNTVKGQPGSRRGFHVRAEGQPRDSVLWEEGAVMMDEEDPEGLDAYREETAEFGSGEENALGYIGKISSLAPEHHRDGFIHKKCMEFLDSYESDGRPLFLYLSFIKPHAGFNIPKQFEDLYDINDIPDLPPFPYEEEPETHLKAVREVSSSLRTIHEKRKAGMAHLTDEEKKRIRLRYLANCSFMDYFIESALNKIREKGLNKNTLFVFCSDHGDMMGERDGLYSKYCLFESSVRVPLILAGDYIKENLRGSSDHRCACLTDIYPTLMAAAGIEKDPRLPGIDLLSEMTHKGQFCEFHGGGTEIPRPAPALMWRNSDYKLILYRHGTILTEEELHGELYDLKNDPHEWHNLYYDPAYRDEREKLTLELIAHTSGAFARCPAYGDYRGKKPIEES